MASPWVDGLFGLSGFSALPVVSPRAGKCGFLLPLLFSQGDGRCSFNSNDAPGGAPGAESCGFTKVWSPLAARKVDLDRGFGGLNEQVPRADEEDQQ